MQMTDFPVDPRETIADTVITPAAPRHDPTTRGIDALPLPGFEQIHDEFPIDRAVQQLSRWAGPVALVATVILLGWWVLR